MTDRETLAKALHEAGRKAVERGATVAAEKFGERARKFLEWDEINEQARDGRRMQADFLLENYVIDKPEPMTDEEKAVGAVLVKLHRAQKKHPGRILLRHQAWGIIEEEFDKFNGAVILNDYDEAFKRLASTAAMCIRTLIDWPLIQHIESNLTILNRLEPTGPGMSDQ